MAWLSSVSGRYPTRTSKSIRSDHVYARSIRLGPTNGRQALVITRVKHTDDIGRIGEIIDIVSQFGQEPLHIPHTYTIDTWRRSVVLRRTNMDVRRQLLDNDQALLELERDLLGDWDKLDEAQLSLVSSLLKVSHARLQRATGQLRNYAADQIAAASSLKDSLGRYNPSVMRTRHTAAIRRLVWQEGRDERSIEANVKRGFLAEMVGLVTEEEIERLFVLLDEDGSEEGVVAQLDTLVIKPYYFAAVFAHTVMAEEGLTDDTRAKIKAAFLKEAAVPPPRRSQSLDNQGRIPLKRGCGLLTYLLE